LEEVSIWMKEVHEENKKIGVKVNDGKMVNGMCEVG